MCVRYEFAPEPLMRWSDVVNAFISIEDWTVGLDTFPGYQAPILVEPSPDSRKIVRGQWGLVPRWAKDASFGKKNAYNARSEGNERHLGIENVPTFKDAIRRRRCIIPATAFYERFEGRWQRITLGDREMMGLAGVWEPPHQTAVSTYAMITTEPNSRVSEIHDRMPVILDEADFAGWLRQESSLEEIVSLLKPYPPESFHIEPRELVSLKAARKELEKAQANSLFEDVDPT